jgi:hypothetical protein
MNPAVLWAFVITVAAITGAAVSVAFAVSRT